MKKQTVYDDDQYHLELIKTVVLNRWSFRSIEHSQFRRTQSLLNDRVKHSSAKQIASLIKKKSIEIMNEIIAALKAKGNEKIFISLDI